MQTTSENYYNLGGTLRRRTAEQTLAWLKPLLPLIGITRVANITGLDHVGIAVTTCMRPNSKHLSVSQGKGLSIALAEISAIMESFEGYHAENPPPIVFYGSYHSLKKREPVISPALFCRSAFQQKDLEQTQLAWVTSRDLISQEIYYIPHCLTCIDSTQSRPEYSYLMVSSNGLAAGNSLDEAICHALYELIERDSLCRWQPISADARKTTQLDLSTITQDSNALLLNKLHAAQLQVKVWDITSVDFNVPAFHCAIADPHALQSLGLFTGTGAHLSKEIALSRALTEAAQARLTLITGNRDDIFPSYYEHVGAENTSENFPNFANGPRDYATCSSPPLTGSFAETIEYLLKVLQQQNLQQILLVDHTKPELQVPVAQLFVPGLQFNGTRM